MKYFYTSFQENDYPLDYHIEHVILNYDFTNLLMTDFSLRWVDYGKKL